jgi:hypothetical protein
MFQDIEDYAVRRFYLVWGVYSKAAAPLAPETHPQCPLALPSKKQSSEQRFAQPAKDDTRSNNKIRYRI